MLVEAATEQRRPWEDGEKRYLGRPRKAKFRWLLSSGCTIPRGQMEELRENGTTIYKRKGKKSARYVTSRNPLSRPAATPELSVSNGHGATPLYRNYRREYKEQSQIWMMCLTAKVKLPSRSVPKECSVHSRSPTQCEQQRGDANRLRPGQR